MSICQSSFNQSIFHAGFQLVPRSHMTMIYARASLIENHKFPLAHADTARRIVTYLDRIIKCFLSINWSGTFFCISFIVVGSFFVCAIRTAFIMYQNAGHIISMVVLNFEVIDRDRSIKNFYPYSFYYAFAVKSCKNISCAKVTRSNPALYRRIERELKYTSGLLTTVISMSIFIYNTF